MARLSLNNIDKKEALYWVASIALFILVAVYLFYSISFLARNAGNVFGDNLNNKEEIVRFNLEKAKGLRK